MEASAQPSADTFAAHRPYLFRYAISRLRQPDTAEDVVQETLLAAVEGQAKFRGDSGLRTWLTGILKHKIVDWRRREARDPVRAGLASHGESDGGEDDGVDAQFNAAGEWVTPPSAWPNPEQSFESGRFWEMFESCLAELPAATARAFYLREIQGMSTAEICAELDISQSNCWVMLYRARMGLRRSIEARGFGDREPKVAPRAPACFAMAAA